VSKQGAFDLRFDYEATALEIGLYEGDVRRFRTSGYTHEATALCRQPGASVVQPVPPGDRYFLVVASGCDPRSEGQLGRDSLGVARPSAADLGLPTCP
jgi:hypothetical protein